MFTASRTMSELKTRLEANVAGVTVYTAPVDSGTKLADAALAFLGARPVEQDYTAVGGARRTDAYIIEGVIHVSRAGAGDRVATAARDAADRLFRDVAADLAALLEDKIALGDFRTAIGAHGLRKLNPRQGRLTQGAADSRRWAQFDIDIEVTAHVIP